MYELRRTRSGPFAEDESLVTLHTLKDAYEIWKETGDEGPLRKCVYPMEYALRDLPKIVVKDSAVDALARGASLGVQGISRLESGIEKGDMVAVFTHMGEVVSIGRARMASDELLKTAEGQAMDTVAVVMKPGIYPSGWKKSQGIKR